MATGHNHYIKGASDLYALMLEVKNGMPNGGIRGFVHITKKQAKECGIEWSFVENSVQILGLQIERHARLGYSISK